MDNDEHVYWVKKISSRFTQQTERYSEKKDETILLKPPNKKGLNMGSVNTLHLCFFLPFIIIKSKKIFNIFQNLTQKKTLIMARIKPLFSVKFNSICSV